MMRTLGLLALCASFPAFAQQGFLPLGRVVDAPWTALMHGKDLAAHSAIRPYLREDIAALPGADTLVPPARNPWLGRITDPANRWYGSPLAEAMAGTSFGEGDMMKYRAGVGAWLGWNATPRLTLGADAMAWHEKLPNYLDRFAHVWEVAPGEGYAHRSGDGIAHFDWNGYADYKAGDYFHFTVGKGRQFIGEGYRSLLLSDEAYSYPYFRITTTAWRIRYINLFALMRDIREADGNSARFAKKFASMHYLSWNISNRVNAGFFEAIIWQDNDPAYPRGFDLSYLNPVIFLRPVEFGLGSPDNALMGAALNVKLGKRSMAYTQLVLDEFLLSHVRAGDGWYGNKQGVQAGWVGHDAFKQKGLMIRLEMNYARPFMYTHTDSRQNYAHYGQPLAHPYGAGFLEGLVQGEWRKGAWLLSNTFSWAIMGQDTSFGADRNYGNNIFLTDSQRPLDEKGKPLIYDFRLGDPVQATVVQNELRAGRLLEPRSGILLEAAWTLRSETAPGFPARYTSYLRVGLSANLHDRHPFQAVR
ncbi:MAG TPA: hypothetical protein PKD45_14325 [Flavobacteriales bacterium]|nr:hypothetical protein [Flavobacteriales bacterium]